MDQNRAALLGGLGGLLAVIAVVAVVGAPWFAFLPLVVAGVFLVAMVFRQPGGAGRGGSA
jgi:type IV secretory pathway VirB2 component (pilin)